MAVSYLLSFSLSILTQYAHGCMAPTPHPWQGDTGGICFGWHRCDVTATLSFAPGKTSGEASSQKSQQQHRAGHLAYSWSYRIARRGLRSSEECSGYRIANMSTVPTCLE